MTTFMDAHKVVDQVQLALKESLSIPLSTTGDRIVLVYVHYHVPIFALRMNEW